jgi:hypothetical protein
MGGQQPIVGTHLYLFAANTTGYGGLGITPSSSNASVSLLTSGAGRTLDTSGGPTNGDYYVTTGAGGVFSITGDYSCAPNTQVYLYGLGGDAGSGPNAAAGLLAALGNCPSVGSFATATPFVVINEVSTVAAAYAFAGFATDATHVSSSGTSLAQVGIQNAFANAANLAGISTGAALATTPAGNGTVPQTEINTLANILAACVNTNGAISGPTSPTACYTLLNDAQGAGSSGTVPSETATAAINMAHNPGTNLAGLYALSTATPPFAPALSAQPNDFTVALTFTGGGLSGFPVDVAIDGSGDAWVTNAFGNTVTELSNTGAFLSGASGFSAGGINGPEGVVIDISGDAWIADINSNSITKLSSSGSALSGASGYSGGGLSAPIFLSIDGSGNVWTAGNSTAYNIVKFSSSGSVLSGTSGYTGGGLKAPRGIAVDGSGSAWVPNNFSGSNSVTKLSSSGTILSGANGYTGGGLYQSWGVAIDSSGNAWISNSYNGTVGSVTELSNSGTVLSGAAGFTGGGLVSSRGIAIDGAGNAWASAYCNDRIVEISSAGLFLSGSGGYSGGGLYCSGEIAIDGSGDAWIVNGSSSLPATDSVSEFIGVAVPVITPMAAGLPAAPTANGSSNLGTRP